MEDTHRIIAEKKREDWSIGETTLTAVAIKDYVLQAGNVGDSPAYLVRGGEMRSLIQEDKGKWGHITQVMGFPDDVQVHSTSLELNDGDIVIVASDGVGHVLWPSIIDPITMKRIRRWSQTR